MNRRYFLGVLTSSSTLLTAGCLGNNDSFEPDISETIRLGTSAPISLDTQPTISTQDSQEFEYEATVRANSLVHDYIGQKLREQELIGAGVFLSINRLTTDEIDSDVNEDEFRRAVPLATVVKQRYQYNKDGELVTQPEPVELDTLLSQLPRTVTVSISSDVAEYEAVLPVVVHRYWVHPEKE